MYLIRKFKQLRSGYKTDAETQNWSYVLRPFVNGTDVAQFKDAPWVEVKGAQWDKVRNKIRKDNMQLYSIMNTIEHTQSSFCVV